MKVAAVIPHWNRASLLRTLLENLKEQSRKFDEVIVVDNGSTDGSADLAEKAGALVIRLDRNYGFAAAVNRGVAATDADWVAILNNDVTLDPAWLGRLCGVSAGARDIHNSGLLAESSSIEVTAKDDYASKRDELCRILEEKRPGLSADLYKATAGSRAPGKHGREREADRGESEQSPQSKATAEVVFATGKILSARDHSILDGAWDEVSRAACPVRIGSGAPDGPFWNVQRPIPMASMTACLIRRKAFTDLGPLDERFESYLEDVDFGLRCAKAGLTGVYEPAAVAYHQGSSTWGRWNPDTVRLLSRNQILLYAKHFRGQPRWPILAGQLLWGLVALRHGCGWAWLKGKLAGLKMGDSIENETRDTQALAGFLRTSEAAILEHCRETYWRLYAWLAPLR
ncbi:MAG: glycosyltransferase family 2 protein [Bryobacteraceae bacterium]